MFIDYTASYFEDQAAMALLVPKGKTSSNMFFFLAPFDINVWVSILGLILLNAVIMGLVGGTFNILYFIKIKSMDIHL